MMLGALGAWVGTAFLATEEAGIERFQKEAITDGGDADTVVSRSLTGKPARMIRNKWDDAWVAEGKEPLPMPYQSLSSGPVQASGHKAQRQSIKPGHPEIGSAEGRGTGGPYGEGLVVEAV